MAEHYPGLAVRHICKQSNVTGHHGKYRYFRSFDWFLWYCITPPVYPTHYAAKSLFNGGEAKQVCIVCNRLHVTSEDCGREPSEQSGRDATVRRDDGYKLIQARNMGMFDD